MEKRVYSEAEADWQVLRPEHTVEIDAAPLTGGEATEVKVSLIRVAPSGEFRLHIDTYHHVFYFIAGEGECRLGDQTFPVGPGRVVEIPAGTPHAYRNTSSRPMLLIGVNLPVK